MKFQERTLARCGVAGILLVLMLAPTPAHASLLRNFFKRLIHRHGGHAGSPRATITDLLADPRNAPAKQELDTFRRDEIAGDLFAVLTFNLVAQRKVLDNAGMHAKAGDQLALINMMMVDKSDASLTQEAVVSVQQDAIKAFLSLEKDIAKEKAKEIGDHLRRALTRTLTVLVGYKIASYYF